MSTPAAVSFGTRCAGPLSAPTTHQRHHISLLRPLRSRPFPFSFSTTTTNCELSGGLLKPVLFRRTKGIAVAADTYQLDSSEPAQKEVEKKYYFVVANAKFMVDEEEHFKELLFERLRLYGERNKEQDFWLVIEPKFLDKFPDITKRLKRPAVALVSTNGSWITFMKLRLDRVLAESYEADSLEEALASNPANLEFEKPENWVAPYPKYEFGWWESFLPPGSNKDKV
ncbi:hypothetical protein Syun_017054 [Stephania yunnanensis]|uniref:Ycf54 n=1 Tax=Stephania yunnanensis TaxID=152371 RepID=A0AAP0P207_9MAGN